MAREDRRTRLSFDSFELDLQTGELTRHGQRVRLQEQPARLLSLLAERAGHLVTRAEIQQELWGKDRFVEFDHAINTAVKKIREALEDDVGQPRLIETLPRKGYRFIGSVQYVGFDEAAPQQTELPLDPEDPQAEPALLSPGVARVLFLIIQAGYLALYCSALYYVAESEAMLGALAPVPRGAILSAVIVTAMCGIAVRLYLASSVGLAHPAAGLQFRRLFPAVLCLDAIWAASPLLARPGLALGLALAAAAGLAYLPFSQRTLIQNIYPAR